MKALFLFLILNACVTKPEIIPPISYLTCYSSGELVFEGEVLGAIKRYNGRLGFIDALSFQSFEIPERMCIIQFERYLR